MLGLPSAGVLGSPRARRRGALETPPDGNGESSPILFDDGTGFDDGTTWVDD